MPSIARGAASVTNSAAFISRFRAARAIATREVFCHSRRSFASEFRLEYEQHVAERASQGLVPLPLTPKWTFAVIELLKKLPEDEASFALDLLRSRVPPGVDEASYVKAQFLCAILEGEAFSPIISKVDAVAILGTMMGGFNVLPLVAVLVDQQLAPTAVAGLSKTILMFDSFHDVADMTRSNKFAKEVMESWAAADWFTSRRALPEKYTTTVFKVTGESSTDDLSPGPDAWSRPDIPMHAMAMLKYERDGIYDAPKQIAELKKKGFPVSFVGDVVGTGSSRKSATNNVLWHIGEDIPAVPNKRSGGVVLGGTIAPIFFNTLEDAGALPIETDVTQLNMGDVIDIYPYQGVIKAHDTKRVLSTFQLKTEVLLDEFQAGGRIPLIIGRGLTQKACQALGKPPCTAFRSIAGPAATKAGYTLAQKIVAKACDLPGVAPGMYVEPKMTTVGSQDTTGPMTRDELKDLACLGFSADLVLQSFCHTNAYPKPVDLITHETLPKFITARGGVSLRPEDGIIHSWLNRMLLPDTVGTGGDSHTRFPFGISFPAGSGLVAFAAATGVMPLDMPESVLVRFTGAMQAGITLRDLVHAIPLAAIEIGLLTVPKKNKKNVFAGRILEIEGLENLKCEQAFELADASAERSAAGCTIRLAKEPIIEYLRSNVVLLKWMIAEGYGDARTLKRRIAAMQDWLEKPVLLQADQDAEYRAVIDIDMSKITEPILCCPNDPDDARPLGDVAGTKIDEVFIGSCMTNIGHFRAAAELLNSSGRALATRLWIAPPTRMDEAQLTHEGHYNVFGKVGARTEMPGCSICAGNQARVADKATVVSTSTRNFPNRMGKGADVYLASAELAATAAILGKIPNKEEYLHLFRALPHDVYKYLNFDEQEMYVKKASLVEMVAA